jgi:hypothetical protein
MKRQLHNFLSLLSGIFFFFFSSKFYAQGVNSPNNFSFSQHDTVLCPVEWGEVKQISNTATQAFVSKILVVGDTIHLIYSAGSAFYHNSFDQGKTWSQSKVIVPSESLQTQENMQPFAAEGSRLYYVYQNPNPTHNYESVKLLRSTNSGRTWLEPKILARGGVNPRTYGVPLVTAYENYIYVAMRRHGLSPFIYYLTRSTDYGETWDSLRQITFVQTYYDLWGELVAAANGRVYFVISRNVSPSPYEIVFKTSTDYGATWSDDLLLSTADTYSSLQPEIEIGDSDIIYVCWQDAKYGSIGGGGAAKTTLLRKSSDYGITWSPEIRVSPLASAVHSSMSVVGRAIHVAWDDERNGSTRSRVMYRMSSNGGTSWCDEDSIGKALQTNGERDIAAKGNDIYLVWSSSNNSPPYTTQVYFRKGQNIIMGYRENELKNNEQIINIVENYPNPFNNTTTITYTLIQSCNIALNVYDILGNNVALLEHARKEAGLYTVPFNGATLSTGTYFISLETNRGRSVQKIFLIK